jgi:hypothetical protein
VNSSNNPGMALKISLRGLGCALAARERKCSSRVIIGLVVIDLVRLGHCSKIPFDRADDRKSRIGQGQERANLISERAGMLIILLLVRSITSFRKSYVKESW